jgi:putative acetyltransferase
VARQQENSSVQIRPETPADIQAVHRIHRAAFDGPDEAVLVDNLRREGYAQISLVAQAGEELVGHILFSPLAVEAEPETDQALALAPVGVLPAHQRRGVGSALIRAGLEEARRQGYPAVIVLGHAEYYPRFGFRAELTAQLEAPFSGPSFTALSLVPGSSAGLVGRVRYAPPFGIE